MICRFKLSINGIVNHCFTIRRDELVNGDSIIVYNMELFLTYKTSVLIGSEMILAIYFRF